MTFFFHPEAEQELHQAISYYENCHPGLGVEFAQEVYQTITRITLFPDSYAQFSKRSRRCILNRFPYGILYSIQKENEEIIVLAIMNLHRQPDQWDARINI